MTSDRDQRIREALERFRPGSAADANYDHGMPTEAVGHARGLDIACHITHNFRETWRPQSMKITPQQVIELIFPGGGDELLEFIQLARDQKPFPV